MNGGNLQGNKIAAYSATDPLTVAFRTSAPSSYTHQVISPAIGSNAIYSVLQNLDFTLQGLVSYDFNGNILWNTLGLTGNNFSYDPAVDADGNIYILSTPGGVRKFNSSGTFQCATIGFQNYVGTVAIDQNGKIVVMTGNGGALRSFNSSDCSLNWVLIPSGSSWNQGSLVIDSNNVIYTSFGTGAGFKAVRGSDGTVLWTNTAPGATNNVNMLSRDESIIYQYADNGTLYAMRTSDGTTLWTKDMGTSIKGLGFGNTTTLYAASQSDNKLYAINSTTGDTIWSFPIGGTGGWQRFVVDSNEVVYAIGDIIYAVNSDGTLKWKYSVTSPSGLAFRSNGWAYFNTANYFYGMKPWAISLSMDNTSPKNGDTVNFTATTSMLKRDPAASTDNLVQVYISNGDKVSLSYDSTDSSGNTIWKGSYTISSSTTEGLLSATAEAIAYNTTANSTLHFVNLASGFNNSGISTSLCFASNTGSCKPGITLNNDPQAAPNGKTRLTGKATLTSGNYTIGSVQYSVNGGGFSGATATDGSFNSVSEEFYFDFDQKSNQQRDSQGNLIDGYTVRIKSTNSNLDVTDNLFYFSPFNQNEPVDNAVTNSTSPTFDFGVIKQKSILKDNLSKYQIQIRKGGNDSTAPWEIYIDDIPIDGILDNTGTVVVDNDKLRAVYTDDSSRIKVYSKVKTLAASMQWKVVAIDKSGHTQDSSTRSLRVNTKDSVTTSNFPLAILNISGLGNPNISTTNLSAIKDTYYLGSLTPIFYGIAFTNAKVTLSLTDQSCKSDCTKTYSTVANQDSRYGINVPRGDFKWGKKYTTNMSVAYNQDYNELPTFTLSTSGFTPKVTTPKPETSLEKAPKNNNQQTTVTPKPTPTPQPAGGQKETSKKCFLFFCF